MGADSPVPALPDEALPDTPSAPDAPIGPGGVPPSEVAPHPKVTAMTEGSNAEKDDHPESLRSGMVPMDGG